MSQEFNSSRTDVHLYWKGKLKVPVVGLSVRTVGLIGVIGRLKRGTKTREG